MRTRDDLMIVVFDIFVPRLFNAQNPQDQRNQNKQIENHIIDAFFLLDKIPDQLGPDKDTDEIIENHNDRHFIAP